MSEINKREGIKVPGYKGTWYVIDETVRDGQTLYLLEHETYGDTKASVIVDSDFEVILEDVWNGFVDYDEAMEAGDLFE